MSAQVKRQHGRLAQLRRNPAWDIRDQAIAKHTRRPWIHWCAAGILTLTFASLWFEALAMVTASFVTRPTEWDTVQVTGPPAGHASRASIADRQTRLDIESHSHAAGIAAPTTSLLRDAVSLPPQTKQVDATETPMLLALASPPRLDAPLVRAPELPLTFAALPQLRPLGPSQEELRRIRLRRNIHFRTTTREDCLPGRLMNVIYDVAERYGEVRIISTFRSPQHNSRVGGVRNSFHLQCRAIDFNVKGRTPGMLDYLRSRPEVGGLKRYPMGFFHIDTGPRRTW